MVGFDKIEREPITQKVYEHIKRSILSGAVAPGTRLLEAEIAEQMGVSRSPVRETFRLLEADGLIETRANQGAFVRQLSSDDVREIYTARSLIEGYIAGLAAAKATVQDVEQLRRALKRVEEAALSEDYEATLDADLDLHRLIWEICGHKVLHGIVTRLEVQIRMFMAVQAPLFDNLWDSIEDHRAIVDAIAGGDGDRARSSMEQHITEAGMLAVAKLGQEPKADS